MIWVSFVCMLVGFIMIFPSKQVRILVIGLFPGIKKEKNCLSLSMCGIDDDTWNRSARRCFFRFFAVFGAVVDIDGPGHI